MGSQDSGGPARCQVGEWKDQTLLTGRMLPGDWLDGGQEAEGENQSMQGCRCAGIQPTGNCRRIHGDVLGVWGGRGKRVLKGPAEDGIAGKFKQASSLQSNYF